MNWLFHYADPTIDWDYAMVTLVVRFIGVFIVMAVIQVALQLSSRLVAVVESRSAPAEATVAAPAATTAIAPQETALDEATAAAIAMALALEARAGSVPPAPGTTSPWGVAGRLQQLRRG